VLHGILMELVRLATLDMKFVKMDALWLNHVPPKELMILTAEIQSMESANNVLKDTISIKMVFVHKSVLSVELQTIKETV
jgi:hypothetical protein